MVFLLLMGLEHRDQLSERGMRRSSSACKAMLPGLLVLLFSVCCRSSGSLAKKLSPDGESGKVPNGSTAELSRSTASREN